jgi:hypothetical protein
VFAGLTPDLLAENRQWLRGSGAIDATDTHPVLSVLCRSYPAPHDPAWSTDRRPAHVFRRSATAGGLRRDMCADYPAHRSSGTL